MTIGTKLRQTKQRLAGNEIAGTNSTYHTVKQCGAMYSAVEGVAPEWGAAVRRRRTHNNFAMSRYTLALVLLAAGLHFIGIDGQNHPIRDALFLGNQSLSNSTLDDCIWRRGGEFDVCPDPDIVYNLYTADEPHAKKQIDLSSEDWLRHSGWDPLHETVFIVHGYAGGDDLLPIIVLRDAYLRRGSYNVIMMDWGPLARAPCYPAAVHNLRAGARCAAQVLAALRRAGLRPERLTCVGHSLGAHLCGIISNYLTFRMYRIIGLDPARPLIRAAPALRLDAGDARAVHVLHTNAGKYGEAARLGTADFCLNGGRNQPFCYDTPNEALCSHIWSICYQAESIFKQRMAEPCGRRCGARPTRARSVSARAALPVPLGQQAPMAATGAFCIEDTLPPFCPKYASGEGDERCCLDKQYAAAAALDTTTRRPFARLREARRRNQEDLYDRTYALPWTITNNRLD